MSKDLHEQREREMRAADRVNILLVDDQPAKLLSYEVTLGELGENLIKANSAREALEVLLKNEIAVVLIDVCMPELDGFELAQMLRDHPRYEKTAIIFISAVHLSDFDRVRGYETGAVDYVPVPVVPEILRAKVRIFAELWRKTRQLERLNAELERRVAERTAELETYTARLSEAVERLQLASEAAGFGTYDYHPAEGSLYWSPNLREIVGLPIDKPLTLDTALAVVHPDHRELVRRHIQGQLNGDGRIELEFKIVRPDGEVRWLLDRGQVLAGGDQRPYRLTGTVLDITERRRNEERQRLLMAELDHRVKNILSNVSAVARLSSHRATSVRDFVDSLDGRIQAISRAHGLLRRSAWGGANLGDLVAEALSPFMSLSGSNIALKGDDISIVPELAQSMALVLHELATNAIKHGALSVPAGRVEVNWLRPAEGCVRFTWREIGGPPPAAPATTGFGLTVLRTIALDLDAVGRYEFSPDGFIYTLEGPFEVEKEPRLQLDKSRSPIAPDASAVSAPGTGQAPPSRILVVEDESLVALQLQVDLEQDGHQVVGPATSLKQGLHLAAAEEIDVALLDVSLGRETSAPIADALRERNIPFAFATGYSDMAMLPHHLRAAPRLTKPYVIEHMRDLLAILIAEGKKTGETGASRHSD